MTLPLPPPNLPKKDDKFYKITLMFSGSDDTWVYRHCLGSDIRWDDHSIIFKTSTNKLVQSNNFFVIEEE